MTKNIRRRVFNLAGRLVRTGRRTTLRLPSRWPWAHAIITAIKRLRDLPAATG